MNDLSDMQDCVTAIDCALAIAIGLLLAWCLFVWSVCELC